MVNSNNKIRKIQNEIIKNQIKLTVRDIEKEIKDNPNKACEILDNYIGIGFVQSIFKLADLLD